MNEFKEYLRAVARNVIGERVAPWVPPPEPRQSEISTGNLEEQQKLNEGMVKRAMEDWVDALPETFKKSLNRAFTGDDLEDVSYGGVAYQSIMIKMMKDQKIQPINGSYDESAMALIWMSPLWRD